MTEQKDVNKEVDQMIKGNEQFEADKKMLFLQEYQALVIKHGYDFMPQSAVIVKVNYQPPTTGNVIEKK